MVDLTPTNAQAAGEAGGIITSEQPRTSVSPQQIAQPYNELSQALDKSGEALGTIAEEAAKQAGLKAVTRDAQGNIQVESAPIVGPASQAYARSVKFAALAEAEQDVKRQDIAMREKYHDDPQSYLAASEAFRQEKIKQYTDIAGPEVGITLGKAINATTTQTFKGLQNEHERLTLQRSEATITAGINSAKDDAAALARGGDTSSPAYQQAVGKVAALTQEKVANPRLAYPAAAAAYDLEQFQGTLKANGFLYHVDQVYKDQGVNEDGSSKGGAANALEAAKNILTDPSIKLTEAQRNAYHSKAVAEVRANEALRKQDIGEARAAAQSLTMVSAYGGKVSPEEVEQVAGAFRAAGAPGEAAKLYATWARRPLNDDFGKQPLSEQTRQLEESRGMPRQKAAYDFFIDKGYSPAQAAGIIGGLRGETATLNTNQVHDGGIGLGISGWNGPRLAALATFAKDNNADPRELRTQLEFVHHELQNGEKAAGDRLRAAQTPEQAGQAMLGYFRPKDFDVPGAHPERAQYARAAFNVFGGGTPDGTGALPVGASTPASSLWLQANHSTTLQKAARGAWDTILSDYDKTGIRPADATINQVIGAARATNDHALLDGIGQGVDRMDLSQRQSQRPLPEQASTLTALKTAGAEGGLSPGQAGVLKDLQRRNEAITTGLEKNPISTTVQNFPDKFRTPLPLDLANPDSLVAGLKQRGQIAQFAKDNWQTKAPSALDDADLHQVQAALDTPNVAVKAGIFSAIATLPEEVRNATLAKIGEKRPDFMVSAAAGSMMRQAPDVAQSVLRGQEAIKADKGYLPTVDADKKSLGDDLDKYLPASTFSLAARTTDNGPYEVARGMIKARYADLSAQSGDTSGKFNSDRLKTAVDDVTGGVLNHNGGSFIAPTRGMPQRQFDRMLNSVSDADLGHTPLPNNLPEANAAMKFTPEERALYQRHLDNLSGPGGVTNADGKRSTLLQVSFEQDGKTYNVPSVYDGKILTPKEAIARAEKEGLDKFPAYGSQAEAEARYQKMHTFMEKDTAQAMRPNPAAVTTLNGQPVTADYLRGSAQLESIGDGRYMVRLGKDPMRPVYAYQGANTEAPQKFVLDLRNRGTVAAGPMTGYDAATAGNSMGGFP